MDPNLRFLPPFFIRCAQTLGKATQQKQIPWDHSSLRMPIYLDRAKQPELSEAALAWSKVNKSDFAELEAFIARYPGSPEANRAQNWVQIPDCIGLPRRVTGCVSLVGRPTSSVRWFRDCPLLSRTHHCAHGDIHNWGRLIPRQVATRERTWFALLFPHFYAAGRFESHYGRVEALRRRRGMPGFIL